jgi:hypothetical protein
VTRASAISYESADLIGGLDDEDLDEDDLDIPSLGEGYYDANVDGAVEDFSTSIFG